MSNTPEFANEKDIDHVASAPFTDHQHDAELLKDSKTDDDELLNAIGYKQVGLYNMASSTETTVPNYMEYRSLEESLQDGQHYRMRSRLWEFWGLSPQLIWFLYLLEVQQLQYG